MVVVCHGGPWTDAAYLRPELDALAASNRVVYWDYRGSGHSSTAPLDTYTFEQLADDLDHLRACLGVEDVRVLAHSMGGAVALSYALRHPQRCKALILIATSPTADLRRLALPILRTAGLGRILKVTARALRYLALWSWRSDSPERTLANFSIMATLQEGSPQTRDEIKRRERLLNNANGDALERQGRRFNVQRRLPEISCPALLIVGTEDAVFAAATPCYGGLRNAERLELQGVGHHPLLEATNLVLPAIAEFVSSAGALPSS